MQDEHLSLLSQRPFASATRCALNYRGRRCHAPIQGPAAMKREHAASLGSPSLPGPMLPLILTGADLEGLRAAERAGERPGARRLWRARGKRRSALAAASTRYHWGHPIMSVGGELVPAALSTLLTQVSVADVSRYQFCAKQLAASAA